MGGKLFFVGGVGREVGVFSKTRLGCVTFLSVLVSRAGGTLVCPGLSKKTLGQLDSFFSVLKEVTFPVFVFLLIRNCFRAGGG